MGLAHNVTLRVHSHATEEEDRVLQALALLAGDAKPERSLAEGHYKNPIVLFEVNVEKRAADKVWERVRAEPAVAQRLLAEAERRTDERGTFYARFDKQRAFEGTVALTRGDDALHFRSKLAAFPARKGPAVEIVRAFLEGDATSPKA